MKLLDAPHGGERPRTRGEDARGDRRRGGRGVLALGAGVLALLVAVGPAAAAPPGGAAPDEERPSAGRGEGAAPRPAASPRIARVRCVRRCAAPLTVEPGGSVRVVGSGLERVSRVVFHGTTSATDDVVARARSQSDRSVLVSVPRSAVSGALSAVATRGLRSAPSPPMTIASAPPPGGEDRDGEKGEDTGAAPNAPAPTGGPGRIVFPVRGAHTFGEAGARFGASRGGRAHEGQDVMAACGTPLVAAAGGVVTHNRFHGLAGNYLVIDGPGFDHVYMHLTTPSPLTIGTTVRAGQAIGTVGATGNARGCHLHFELWTDPGYRKGGRAIDPLPLLRRAGG